MNGHNKIIVICGPTATGKSALAVDIAKRFNGEIISADSRQVYRGLDVGTAKITHEEMRGTPHHLIDVADPRETFTVAQFQELARDAIADIQSREKLPILCGGTGLYISSVIDNVSFPQVAPDMALRKELEKLSVEELFEKLATLDPGRAESVDKKNKVRLIRAIEIASSPVSPAAIHPLHWRGEGQSSLLIIGLNLPKEELMERIHKRIEDRIPALFDEIKKLLATGVSEERLFGFGLEYRYGLEYIQGKMSLDVFKETLATKTWQYVRRQMTWFKRDERIHWMHSVLDKQKTLELIQDFLK